MRRLLAVAVLVSASCQLTQTGEVAVDRAAILGGTADTASLPVFLLALRYDTGDTGFCTATLISARTLLTAAHCADPAEKGAASITIQATNKPTSTGLMPGDVIDVVDKRIDPMWNSASRPRGNDIAVLLLRTAPGNATPIAIDRALASTLVGQNVRAVGYGRTSAGTDDSGTRHSVSTKVSALDAETFDLGQAGQSGICFGDSGGPSLITVNGVERIAGVHSFGTTGQCGAGVDVRADRHAAFIDAWLADKEPAQCGGDGRCVAGCTPDDPDCTSDGQSCAAAGQCAGGVCATFCTRACAVDAECRNGMTCMGNQCSLMGRPMASRGEVCTQGLTKCEAGTACAAPVGSPTICREACAAADAGDQCPMGASCTGGQGEVRFCYAASAMPVDGGSTMVPPATSGGCSSTDAGPVVFAVMALMRRRARRHRGV